jgi:pyruvate,water dikinase
MAYQQLTEKLSMKITEVAARVGKNRSTVSNMIRLLQLPDSVKELIKTAVKKCQEKGKYIGICGQGPSDFPDFAEFLVTLGIESMSLNPDSIIKTKIAIAQKEKELKK